MKTTKKIKVNQLWYSKQIQWSLEEIENKSRQLKDTKARKATMLAGFPSEHDVKQGVTLEMLTSWIEKYPKDIEELKQGIAEHKAKFEPCKNEVPNFNKFMQFWITNIEKLVNYEMDYYHEYAKLIESCYIPDSGGDDESTAEIDEICEQIQILTGINDRVRFR